MSDPLYTDGEETTCRCTKCGWVGTAAAPMFNCGGCKRYVARPIDMEIRQLKAARAEITNLRAQLATAREALNNAAWHLKGKARRDPQEREIVEQIDEALAAMDTSTES